MARLFVSFISLLIFQSAGSATVQVCATYDDYNKYIAADAATAAAVENQAVRLCRTHKVSLEICRRHLRCQSFPNVKATRISKVEPFPPELRGHPASSNVTSRRVRPNSRESGSTAVPPTQQRERDKNPGGSCRSNSDCFSAQYCASGQCFEKTGGGGQSCNKNSDCFSSDFCVGNQCFPKSGSEGHSCRTNSDCFSSQFCISGACFEK